MKGKLVPQQYLLLPDGPRYYFNKQYVPFFYKIIKLPISFMSYE